jgi:hypothetical protein
MSAEVVPADIRIISGSVVDVLVHKLIMAGKR